jgi:hypothetical protein
MKHIQAYLLLLLSVFLISCGQNQPALLKNNSKPQTNDSNALGKYIDSLAQDSLRVAEIYKARDDGTIYQSESHYHNVVHAFTYAVAMRDYCSKSLLQMRANAEPNKKLSKELEMELLKAKLHLTSPIFNGLKIEPGLYEKFLKQIYDRG